MVELSKNYEYIYIYKLYLEILVDRLLVVHVSSECLKVLWCIIPWRMIGPALSLSMSVSLRWMKRWRSSFEEAI